MGKTHSMSTEIHCAKCASVNVVFRKKRGACVCEDCGYVSPKAPVAPLRIFLRCGYDANKELVCRIGADLKQHKHDVPFDKNRIEFGDEWRRETAEWGLHISHKGITL